jgi:hypothetical protein
MEHKMKYLAIAAALLVSACVQPMDPELVSHLEAERDFAAWMTDLRSQYDEEYISDCFEYEDLFCEFEEGYEE